MTIFIWRWGEKDAVRECIARCVLEVNWPPLWNSCFHTKFYFQTADFREGLACARVPTAVSFLSQIFSFGVAFVSAQSRLLMEWPASQTVKDEMYTVSTQICPCNHCPHFSLSPQQTWNKHTHSHGNIERHLKQTASTIYMSLYVTHIYRELWILQIRLTISEPMRLRLRRRSRECWQMRKSPEPVTRQTCHFKTPHRHHVR